MHTLTHGSMRYAGRGFNVPFDLVRSKIGMGGDKLLLEVAGIDDEVGGR